MPLFYTDTFKRRKTVPSSLNLGTSFSKNIRNGHRVSWMKASASSQVVYSLLGFNAL